MFEFKSRAKLQNNYELRITNYELFYFLCRLMMLYAV